MPHPVTEPRIIRLLGECANHYNNAFQNVFVYLHCILQVDKMTVKFDLTVLISRVIFHQCGGQQQVRKYKVKMKHPLLKADESSSALNYSNKRKLKFDPFPPFTAGHSLLATTVPHLND